MRIISQKKIRDYVALLKAKGSADHSAVKAALESWYAEAKKADWANPAEVKRHYASASIVSDDRVVFNIKGND
jgi:mRNA interferase HigB